MVKERNVGIVSLWNSGHESTCSVRSLLATAETRPRSRCQISKKNKTSSLSRCVDGKVKASCGPGLGKVGFSWELRSQFG